MKNFSRAVGSVLALPGILPAVLWAFIRWPKFSLTSFLMVSSIARQGVMPKSVIDVGANVGQFSIAIAKLFSEVTVHSFEPNPNCFSKLQKHIASFPSITAYPIGLGEEEYESNFHLNVHSHSSSILPITDNHIEAFPTAREIGLIKIKVSTLDSIFSTIDLPSPVLLKIDVQGYEEQVLRGGIKTLNRVDYVILEASFRPMYDDEMLFMDLVRLMERLGFVFLRPVGLWAHPNTGEIMQMDALFERA